MHQKILKKQLRQQKIKLKATVNKNVNKTELADKEFQYLSFFLSFYAQKHPLTET